MLEFLMLLVAVFGGTFLAGARSYDSNVVVDAIER